MITWVSAKNSFSWMNQPRIRCQHSQKQLHRYLIPHPVILIQSSTPSFSHIVIEYDERLAEQKINEMPQKKKKIHKIKILIWSGRLGSLL